jgi:chaperone modulatory protein CbpM
MARTPSENTPEIAGNSAALSLDDLCLSCNVDADWVVELVEHGVVEPVGVDRTQWRFASVSVVRIAKAKRLQRDLLINPPGVALALDLLDQIDDLRARLRLLQSTTPD